MNSRSKYLLYLFAFFITSLAFAQQAKISLNGSPAKEDTKVKLGDKVEVTVTGDDWVRVTIDGTHTNSKESKWAKKTVTLSKVVDKQNTDIGSMQIMYFAKDDDNMFAGPNSDYDSLDAIFLKTATVTYEKDPTPGKVKDIVIRKNGVKIDEQAKVRLGDTVEVTVTGDDWVKVTIDGTHTNSKESKWAKKTVKLSKVVDKQNTDKGSMQIMYFAKDDDNIFYNSRSDYDSSYTIWLKTLNQSFIKDGTPGKVKSIEVKINPPVKQNNTASPTKGSGATKQ